jgi:ABC-type multidrug transport system fused ATPase/permease subunit
MTFWDFVLFLFYSYLLVAYLIIMFQIIADIFRDPDLGGGMKALWFIGLVILPVIIAVVYLITRSRGMAERQAQRMQRRQGETEGYIQSVAARANPAEQISSAKALLDAGTITQPEFEVMKAKALAA